MMLKFCYVCIVLVCLSSSVSYAGGFQVWDEDTATIGNNHAGAAANAESAAAEYYNPATIVMLKHPQISFASNVFLFKTLLEKGGQYGLQPTTMDVHGDTTNLVPNFHAVYPLNQKLTAAFGLSVPFGADIAYAPDSELADYATITRLVVLDANPSLAYKVNSKFSIGAGLNLMYGQFVWSNSLISNKLAGLASGYNFGLLYQFDQHNRLGLAYRSAAVIRAKGSSYINYDKTMQSSASINFPLPATTTLSFYHALSPRISVMSSVFYSQWGKFKTMWIRNTALRADVSQTLNFRNTWNVAFGMNYEINPAYKLKFGLGFDQTPTNKEHRDVRSPESDHYTMSFGLHYKMSNKTDIDVGYAHIFMPAGDLHGSYVIHYPGAPTSVSLHGKFRTSDDTIGLQIAKKFQ